MISGKIYTDEFVVVLCGVKATGSPKAKGRLFWECPCPTASPGVRTVTVKLINFFSGLKPGGYHMGITV
jgi:hypothetical protein